MEHFPATPVRRLLPMSPAPPACSVFYEPRSYPTPRVAHSSPFRAPVHIDVGGVIYTSSLCTLTRYPDSKLSKMFNGEIPIVLDTLKQHYFIDRDGNMFRHILNFLRNNEVMVPYDYPYLDLLFAEATYFELHKMVCALTLLKEKRDTVKAENQTDSRREDFFTDDLSST